MKKRFLKFYSVLLCVINLSSVVPARGAGELQKVGSATKSKALTPAQKIKCVAIPGGIVLVGVASFLVYRKLNNNEEETVYENGSSEDKYIKSENTGYGNDLDADLSDATELTKKTVKNKFKDSEEVDLSKYANLKSIGSFAFKNRTNLKSITLPENMTEIGEGAFYDCTSLTSITLPSSVTYIDSFAFGYCESLTTIDLSNCTNLQSIGQFAFLRCTSLKSIKAPEALRTTRFSILELPKDCSIKYV